MGREAAIGKGMNWITVVTIALFHVGAVAALFNPRRDVWTDHFVFRGGEILGLTSTGRTTVRLLNMNAPRRVELREGCRRDAEWQV